MTEENNTSSDIVISLNNMFNIFIDVGATLLIIGGGLIIFNREKIYNMGANVAGVYKELLDKEMALVNKVTPNVTEIGNKVIDVGGKLLPLVL